MGWDYTFYRTKYEIFKKIGLLKWKFPESFKEKKFITLKEWRKNYKPFFFDDREEIKLLSNKKEKNEKEYHDIIKGRINFFNAVKYDLGNNYDWVTNPENGYKYNARMHWINIPDFSEKAGDIKFVWEKSRFVYLYTIIRYDQKYKCDNSKFVFSEMISWINSNPLNCGPNFLSGQEICIRLLNWIFALYFYKDSENLTEELFQTIMNSIYRQTDHVFKNINFSRKTVRNNHAVTETLTLYLAGLIFPFFNHSNIWRTKGKKWFEEEINYQIYDDGTYIQYSMNYHRAVIQLLTWAFYLSEINDDKFSEDTYRRCAKSIEFLMACQNKFNGQLPNYGANDGSLFFQLNDCEYRDYRPQLNAIYYYFTNSYLYKDGIWNEDINWYSINLNKKRIDQKTDLKTFPKINLPKEINTFKSTGYFIIRDEETLIFIRCGNHKDRPSQADNLHLDLWYEDMNILHDGGSYKYNTDKDMMKYFFGTASHNTVMLEDYDQMLKGPRFIWLNWTQAIYASLTEDNDNFIFKGEIRAFNYLNKKITAERKVTKKKGKCRVIIEDKVINKPNIKLHQIWNTNYPSFIDFNSVDNKDNEIKPIIRQALYSDKYGVLEPSSQIIFSTVNDYIKTEIKIKS